MRARAGCARAFVAQVGERIVTVMAIAPVDFDAARFRYGNVFRIGNRGFLRCTLHGFNLTGRVQCRARQGRAGTQ